MFLESFFFQRMTNVEEFSFSEQKNSVNLS